MQKRLFIGFKTSKEIAKVIPLLKTTINQKDINAFKWLSGQSIHITLAFLGNIDVKLLLPLIESIKKIINIKKFILEVEGTGVFPSQKYPHILWLGINNGEKILIELQNQINSAITPLIKNKRDEQFKPHITIARLKNQNMKINVSSFLNTVYSPIEFLVDSIYLYESQLSSQGVIYTSLAMFPLS